MAVKAILTDINEAADALRGFYTQKELGGETVYALEVEGVDDHPAVANLKNAYERVKADRQTLSAELKAAKDKAAGLPEDFDRDEWDRLRADDEARQNDPSGKDERARIEAALASTKSMYEARIARMAKDHERVLGEKDQTITEQDAEIRTRLVGGGLREVLTNIGVKQGLINTAVRSFEHDVEVVIEDGQRVARMRPELGGGDIGQYFQNWANSEEAKDFIDPARGGGATGSRSSTGVADNPFSQKSWSKTAQGAALRTDRARAERLAKSAGFRSLEAALAASAPNE